MIKPRDIKFVDTITKYVQKNKIENAYTVGALLVEKKTILAWGLNSYDKTTPHTPQIKNYVIPTHAEVNCLSKYISRRKYLNDDCSLYVVGLTKAVDPNYVISSFPCESCMSYIKLCGVKRIVYVCNYGKYIDIRDHNVFE